jgi:hypothetical protein
VFRKRKKDKKESIKKEIERKHSPPGPPWVKKDKERNI